MSIASRAIKYYFLKKAIRAIIGKEDAVVSDLKSETPVDTGKARAGWRSRRTENGFEVYNDVEYISVLNDGHSQQAPENFVEHTLSKYGKVMPR